MLVFFNCKKYLPYIYIWFISNPNITFSKYEKENVLFKKKQVCYYRDFDVWYCSTLRFGRVDDKGTMVGLTKDS
jgi:hypothetical protein